MTTREIKLKFVENAGTKYVKVRPFTREEVEKCRTENQDTAYTTEEYMIAILEGRFSNIHLIQSTGLKDKNGKEIYEGDIVRYYRHVDFDNPEKMGYVIGEIWWYEEMFAYFINNDSLFDLVECEDFEVIGNIYENPDLIK